MQVIKIPITQIVCNEWNPNVMSPKQRQALNESLEEFGDILPLVVRKVDDNYQIVDGQHRFESLQNLPEVDCVVIDVSDTQAMRLTQILNRTRGEDDPERLAELLETLSSQISIEELIHGMPIDSEAEFNELLEGLQAGLPQDEDEDLEDGFEDDNAAAVEEKLADAAFTLGYYRFVVSREKYDRWETSLREAVGLEKTDIEAEIKRRLGL